MKTSINVIYCLTLLLSTSIFANNKDACEEENYKNCALGIKWGTKINDDNMSSLICKNVADITDWSNLNCSPLGSTQEQRLKNHCTHDWCQIAQRDYSKIICAKKAGQYCYLGSKNHFNASAPDMLAILYALGMIAEDFIKDEKTTDETAGFEAYPVEYNDEVNEGVKARYLVTWHYKLLAYLTESFVPLKLDHRFFIAKAEQKHGKPLRRISEPKLILNRYSDIIFWGELPKNKEEIPTGQLQIMMVAPKQGNTPATIYSGILDIGTLLYIRGALEDMAMKKQETERAEETQRMKKGGGNVEY